MLIKNVWEKQLDNIFKEKEETEIDIILKAIPIILYNNCNDTDQADLYEIFGLDGFIKFNKFFDGKSVKSIRESELKDLLHFTLVYYFKEVKNYDWDKIKRLLPFDVNTISCALRIKNLNEKIKLQLEKLMSKLDEKTVINKLKGVK